MKIRQPQLTAIVAAKVAGLPMARLPVGLMAGLLAASMAGCDAGRRRDPAVADGRAKIVVTYAMIGTIVKQVVGAKADVTILMPKGADPHEWSPSATDVEKLKSADLVIQSGLGLEGHLKDPLKEAKAHGIPIFTATDHVVVRRVNAGEGADASDPDQATGAQDPHIWMDPLTMREWVGALVPVLKSVGVDAGANAAEVESSLTTLDAEVAGILAKVPVNDRKLVTGHESLGYFAKRYKFKLAGAIVPTLTSQAEASAGRLAELERKVRSQKVRAIFTELGTPASTTKAVAYDLGIKVVALPTHVLPADGSYRSFMLDTARTVANALTPSTALTPPTQRLARPPARTS